MLVQRSLWGSWVPNVDGRPQFTGQLLLHPAGLCLTPGMIANMKDQAESPNEATKSPVRCWIYILVTAVKETAVSLDFRRH